MTVTGSGTATATALTAPAADMPGPDGARYLIETVVSGLDKPAALAKLPDGRLLIAESRGRVRIADSGRLLDAPAVEFADADTDGGEGWSLAVAPDFAASRNVYVGYAARDDGGVAQSAGWFAFVKSAECSVRKPVILDNLPAEVRAPRTRIGPDGALYVGTTARNPRDAENLSSEAGKVLRFTTAGLMPLDNPLRFSPVYSFGHRGRLDFDWEPSTGELWHVETDPGGRIAGAHGRQATGRAPGVHRGYRDHEHRVPGRRRTRRLARIACFSHRRKHPASTG